MDKREVVIKIVDFHDMDGETEGTEIVSVATIEGDENDYTIRYNEQGELEGCEVSLNVKDKNTVTMTRTGHSYSTRLIIQQGERHNCFYRTPAGEMMIGVYAKSVLSNLKDDEGELTFSYTLSFNSDFVSENDLRITVKKA